MRARTGFVLAHSRLGLIVERSVSKLSVRRRRAARYLIVCSMVAIWFSGLIRRSCRIDVFLRIRATLERHVPSIHSRQNDQSMRPAHLLARTRRVSSIRRSDVRYRGGRRPTRPRYAHHQDNDVSIGKHMRGQSASADSSPLEYRIWLRLQFFSRSSDNVAFRFGRYESATC